MSFQTYAAGCLFLLAPVIFLLAIYRGRAPGVPLDRVSRPVGFWVVTLAFMLLALLCAWMLWIEHPQTANLLYLIIIVRPIAGLIRLALELRRSRPVPTSPSSDDRISRGFLVVALTAFAALLSVGALLLLGQIMSGIL